MRLALAIAVVMGAVAAPSFGPCDVKKTEPATWCEKCDKLLDKAAIKDGKCKECDVKARRIDLCVKPLYVCGCGGGDCCRVEQEKPGKCLCNQPLEDKSDRARVVWVCEACSAKSYFKDEVKHDTSKHPEGEKAPAVKKSCEKSGRGVHFTK